MPNKSRCILIIFFLIASFFSNPLYAENLCKDYLLSSTKAPLVNIKPNSFEYAGLTDHGLTVLKSARDIYRRRVRLFKNDIRNLDTLHHAGSVARLFKGNMFIYGPPGGAKSMFVNWMFNGESDDAFKIQLHQMITEQAFTGGQDFEAAKLGLTKFNTKGSLVDFAIALIDEIEKGNPSALASLLSLLNEREVLLGNQVIKARLETLFATSNANLPEFFQQFLENGQGSTAPALLNRFQFKAFVYNWLSPDDQVELDARIEKRRALKALQEFYPEVRNQDVYVKPEPLPWSELRPLALSLFKTSPLFMTFYREFLNEMRIKTNQAIRQSETQHKNDPMGHPFVYFPSADYTERLRQQIPEIIIYSAFLDFLQSPLADDENLASNTRGTIELDPLSLWRASLVLTTIGPGQSRIKIDPKADSKIDIEFDWSVNPSEARDEREELLIQNLISEQERFRITFIEHIERIQQDIELRARHINPDEAQSLQSTSFEMLMQSFKQDN